MNTLLWYFVTGVVILVSEGQISHMKLLVTREQVTRIVRSSNSGYKFVVETGACKTLGNSKQGRSGGILCPDEKATVRG